MNKLCSRNTALATAAGRSGCAPVVSQPLAVFSPFDVLVRFTLSFALFIFLLLLCAIHVRGVPFSQPSTHWRISFFFPLSLSFSQVDFFHPSTTLLQTSDVSPLFRSLCFFFASVNDPGVSPSSFLPRSLLRPCSRATPRAAAAASQSRARNSPLATSLFARSSSWCAGDRTNIK